MTEIHAHLQTRRRRREHALSLATKFALVCPRDKLLKKNSPLGILLFFFHFYRHQSLAIFAGINFRVDAFVARPSISIDVCNASLHNSRRSSKNLYTDSIIRRRRRRRRLNYRP